MSRCGGTCFTCKRRLDHEAQVAVAPWFIATLGYNRCYVTEKEVFISAEVVALIGEMIIAMAKRPQLDPFAYAPAWTVFPTFIQQHMGRMRRTEIYRPSIADINRQLRRAFERQDLEITNRAIDPLPVLVVEPLPPRQSVVQPMLCIACNRQLPPKRTNFKHGMYCNRACQSADKNGRTRRRK
jgi:hypothetical protein